MARSVEPVRSSSERRSIDGRSTVHSVDEGPRLSTLGDGDAFPNLSVALFDTAHASPWRGPVSTSCDKIYRQLLGLNPFKNTYLSLYDPLDSAVERSIAVVSAFFAIAAGVPLPVIGYIFGKIINQFPPEPQELHDRLVQLLGVAVAYFVSTAIYTIGFGITAENVSVKLRRKLLDCLLHLDQAYLDTHDIDVNGLLTEKMDTIQAGCSEKVGIFIQALSYFVAAFIVGFILDAKLTGILLASVVPAITICFVLLSPAISRANRAASGEVEKANEIVESALAAIKVVQAFDMISELTGRHMKHLKSSTSSHVRKAVFAALQSGSVYFIAFSANALAFYLGSRTASDGNAGTVYAVVFLILDASFVVGQFAPFLEIFARAASAKSSIEDLFDARRESQSAATHRRTGFEPDLRNKDICFEDVSFQYPARPTVKVLKNLDLTLRAGTFTSVVGTSGGGKSTVVSLLLGIYTYSGKIKFGEDDVKLIDSRFLRSQVAVLDQDTSLFSGTIFENVCYGLIGQELTMEEKTARCERALRDANVDFIKHLPQGIHTSIGNEIQLSGGQRQRVCLARALIKQPALLILDEPTSALDARSEVAVTDAIKRVAATGTTILMVAHRLSTVLDADHILVMSEGRVVEQGTPQQLCVDGTVFRGLLDAQRTSFNNQAESSDEESALVMKRTRSSRTASVGMFQSDDDQEVESSSLQAESPGLWHLTKHLLRIIKPEAWISGIGLVASVVSGGILLGQAVIFGNLIELLNGGRLLADYYSRADLFSLMFFVLALVALSSYFLSGASFGITSSKLTGRVQSNLLNNLLHLDIQWFSEAGHSTHQLMAAFTKDPGDLASLGGVALGAIFTIVTSVIGGIILALCVAWKISVVLLSVVPVMIVAGYARLRLLTISETKHREAYSGATSLAAEACRNRRAVTALCLEEQLWQEYQEALRKPYLQIRNFVLVANTLLAFCFSVTYFVYALAYWWGSKQVRNGTYSATQFFIVLPALLFSAQAAGQFFSLSPEIARAKSAARSVFALLDARPRIMQLPGDSEAASKLSQDSSSNASALTGLEKTEKPSSDEPKLEFRNVSLQYSNTDRFALERVNLQISCGTTVAFVGPSGAGKSSAMALLERFYDCTEGSMLIDGLDFREIDVRRLRSRMGLVSQDADLFSGSISYNVKLGSAPEQNISDEDVVAACQKCGLHDFITSLPEGYDTECGSSSSSRLSGGQKQRLAIARALVRNPEVLLLDEPTSALDAHSEVHVQAALTEATKGRTTIMVAHRLASIRHADQIFVFEHGKVVARGTHSELLEQGGLYASMAKAQSLA